MFSSCVVSPAPCLAHSRYLITICSMTIKLIKAIQIFILIRAHCGKPTRLRNFRFFFYKLQGVIEGFREEEICELSFVL